MDKETKDLIRRLDGWAARDTVMSEFGPDEHIAGIAAKKIITLLTESSGLVAALREVIAMLIATDDFKKQVLEGTADLSMFNITDDGAVLTVTHKLDSDQVGQK